MKGVWLIVAFTVAACALLVWYESTLPKCVETKTQTFMTPIFTNGSVIIIPQVQVICTKREERKE